MLRIKILYRNNSMRQELHHPRPCPVCLSPKSRPYKNLDTFSYVQCSRCTGIYVTPIKEQSFYLDTETYLNDPEFYTGRIDPYGQRWMIEQFERLYKSLLGEERTNILEIGAGVGFLELTALSRGWDVKGIETSASAVAFAEKYYKVDITQSTIEDLPVGKKYGAFIMVEVLEHFIDPIVAIESLKKHAKPHALIFGTTPNTDSAHWRESEQNIYVPEDHIFLFNEKSIRIFASKTDIKDFKVEYFGSGNNHDSNLMYCGVL